jgi:hypothetical protein
MCLSHLLPFVTDSSFQWLLLLLVAFASIMMMMKMKMMKEEAIFVSIAEGNLNNIYMKKKSDGSKQTHLVAHRNTNCFIVLPLLLGGNDRFDNLLPIFSPYL